MSARLTAAADRQIMGMDAVPTEAALRLRRFRFPRIILLLILGAILQVGAPSYADTWLPPQNSTFASQNGQYRFLVLQADTRNPLTYYEQALDAVNRGQPIPSESATGVLQQRAEGGWRTIWRRTLVNALSPNSAIVSDDGRSVVTFDNHYGIGYGDDVVVIYGHDGRLIRKYGLDELVSPITFAALPRSVSSIIWPGQHRFSDDGRAVTLQIVYPDIETMDDGDRRRFFTTSLDTSTGRIVDVSAEPNKLLRDSCRVLQGRHDRDLANWRFRTGPLTAPSLDVTAWHQYLDEYDRRRPAPGGAVLFRNVLFSMHSRRYQESVGWLKENLDDDFIEGVYVASPREHANLRAELVRIAAGYRPGELHGKIVAVAINRSNWAPVRVALERAGAQAILIDVDATIPAGQRPAHFRRPDPLPEICATLQREELICTRFLWAGGIAILLSILGFTVWRRMKRRSV